MLLQLVIDTFEKDGDLDVVSIPQAVGAVATVRSGESMIACTQVSIPQAVGAVATLNHGWKCIRHRVSIPQAVGAVATGKIIELLKTIILSFNTASGRCCCNNYLLISGDRFHVSIPQAVGAVATNYHTYMVQ